jgi:hypothetical protein
MKRRIITVGLVVTGLFMSLSANAALMPVTAGPLAGLAVYDNVLDITWTQDADINGVDTWADQMTWAAALTVGGVSGWRLPSMDVNGDDAIVDCQSPTTELACRDNEYGYLFHQYGVTGATHGLFTNVLADRYWSGTEHETDPGRAWLFHFGVGTGSNNGNGLNLAAWAVRDGNVAAVPVPAAVWLFGSALGLLGWMRRKRT